MFDRAKDWLDIDAMIAYGSPDVGEVRRWLSELLGDDDHRLPRLDQISAAHD